MMCRWGSGGEWGMGLFLIGGNWPEDSATKLKRGRLNECTVYMVSSPPPCDWNLCKFERQFLSVVDNSKVWGIWFGLAVQMSDISQIASRGGGGGGKGEFGTKFPISLHYLAQGEGQGGELRSLPLRIAGIFLRSGFANAEMEPSGSCFKAGFFSFDIKTCKTYHVHSGRQSITPRL